MAVTINASTSAGLVQTADTSGVLQLQTATTTAVTVDASQNVGIGTASPAQTLHVKTSTSGTPITLGVLSNATGLPALSFNGAYASTTMAGIYANGATSTGLYYMIPAGNSHFFGIADVTKMTLNSDGNVKLSNNISVGNATPTTSGAGITFPVTQSASSDANTLDDYEEGTWTPVMSGSTTAGTGTYSGQAGAYRKIGSVVYYSLDLSWTAHTGTGNMNLSGLPFTSNGTYCAASLRASSGLALTASHYPQAFVNINATTFSWEQFPVGGGFQSAIPMDTSAGIMIAGFYFV